MIEEKLVKNSESIQLPDSKGIYIIYASTSAIGFKPKPIPRCGGIDYAGRLYIGQGNLKDRIYNFRRYINAVIEGETITKDWHHSGGKRYAANVNGVAPNVKNFQPDMLYFSWYEVQGSRHEEKRLLEEYFSKYGEVPPFNASGEKIGSI